jgi:glutamyl-tRNA synthetase
MSDPEVRVRIAPSPTGDPHVGTAYIALFNYCFAKSQGGKFILRIEDTDQARSTKESEEAIFRAIRWVGLPYDEGPDIGGPYGPYRQSERTAIYQEHANLLLARGTAYRCFCTEQQLTDSRKVSEERSKKLNDFIKETVAPLKKILNAKPKPGSSAPPEDSQKLADAAAQIVAATCLPLDEHETPAAYFDRARSVASFIGYDRTCRRLKQADSDTRAKDKEPFVIRLAMPETGKTIVKDRLRGDVEFLNLQIDDQVLMKSDGFPTYHLANIVDDHLMKITHVIRAEEWVSSTPKHVALYEAFGWEAPQWIHMPLLRNKDKSKISKRKNPVSLDYYRDAGILPEALRNFLGLMGWAISGDREKFTLEEMIKKFTETDKGIDAVHLGGPVFDLEKLWALNGVYIRELAGVVAPGQPADTNASGNAEKLLERLLEWRLGKDFLLKLVPLVAARMTTLADFIPGTEFFFAGDLNVKALAADVVPKGAATRDIADLLLAYAEVLDGVRAFTATALEAITREFCSTKAIEPKLLFMSLRVSLTGRSATPPLFETMEVLGKELSRRRLRTMAEQLLENAKKEEEEAKKLLPKP